jgi:hypothetical protein
MGDDILRENQNRSLQSITSKTMKQMIQKSNRIRIWNGFLLEEIDFAVVVITKAREIVHIRIRYLPWSGNGGGT